MKRTVICVIVTIIEVSGLFAQSEELNRIYDNANRLYLEQKYDSSIVHYEFILRNGYESGELYYNIGDAYYKLGKLQYAILNYERAKKIMPDDEDLQFNLRLANLQVTDKVDPIPELFVYRWANALLTMCPLKTMVWILYGLFLLALGAFSYYLFSHRYRQRRYSLLVGLISVIVLVFGTANILIQSYRAEKSEYAVVMTDAAEIKAAPDSTGNDLFVIHRGLKVQVLDDVNNWRKIRLADGKIGWIQKNDVESI